MGLSQAYEPAVCWGSFLPVGPAYYLGSTGCSYTLPSPTERQRKWLGETRQRDGHCVTSEERGEVWRWAVLIAEAPRSRRICGSFPLEK